MYNEGLLDLIREKKVWEAVRVTKKKKAVGPDEVLVKNMKMLRGGIIGKMKDLFNKVLVKMMILKEWRNSFVVPNLTIKEKKTKKTYKNVEIIKA